jgi:hypothetical protein
MTISPSDYEKNKFFGKNPDKKPAEYEYCWKNVDFEFGDKFNHFFSLSLESDSVVLNMGSKGTVTNRSL